MAALVRTGTIPIPKRGWNASSALSDMRPDEAIRLVNAVVKIDGVYNRQGISTHASGLGNSIGTIMAWSGEGGASKLCVATETSIFDVTPGGAVGTAVLSGLHSDRWSWSLLSNIGGTLLWACNDADADGPIVYTGSEWIHAAIEGCEAGKLYPSVTHHNRIFAAEKGTLRLWYLDTHAVHGPVAMVDLAPLCRAGGSIVALASLPAAGGRSPADRLVIVTSAGEVVIYDGADPDSAATWRVAGVHATANPVGGARSIGTLATMPVLLTTAGLVSLSAVIAGGTVQALTDPIHGALLSALDSIVGETGWQVIDGADDELLIINVPFQAGAQQFVWSARTKAWSAFAGIAATCWGLMDGRLYCGTATGDVMVYGGGVYDDAGTAIETLIVHAYNRHGNARTKSYHRARPVLMGPRDWRPRMELAVDYVHPKDAYPASQTATLSQSWDGLTWQEWNWGNPPADKFAWRGIAGRGVSAALIVSIKATAPVAYRGADITYTVGESI